MTYQVLARKWRPRTFEQLVGQEHVVRALVNALDTERVHHCMLFTGTRGVGKTTIARIFAKALNCETGVSSHPCGECGTCSDIDEGRFFDLIEVDAASRTKVDDTRELLENVQYAPTRGRYKVYLIDEVHMLSTHSFNALLKTLEEPPPHVKFLLATTDPQKLPVTILSRCLQFNLKRLSGQQIADYLSQLISEEQVEAEAEAVEQIAASADGSMRDALSLLDQAIAFGGGKLAIADVRSMLGTVEGQYLDKLVQALCEGDPAGLWQTCQELIEYSPDYGRVLGELSQMFHQAAIQQMVPEVQAEGQAADVADAMHPEDVQLCYQIAATGRSELDLAPDHRTGFEMTLLRMLAFCPAGSRAGAQAGNTSQSSASRSAAPTPSARPVPPAVRPAAEQARPPQPASNQAPAVPSPPAEPPSQARPEEAEVPAGEEARVAGGQASEGPVGSPADAVETPAESGLTDRPETPDDGNWESVIHSLGLKGPAAMLAQNSTLSREGERLFKLTLDARQQFLHTDSAEDTIRSGLERFYGKGVRLKIETGATSNTPAEKMARASDQRQQAAESKIASDPNVLRLQEQLGAEIVPGSVRPLENNN